MMLLSLIYQQNFHQIPPVHATTLWNHTICPHQYKLFWIWITNTIICLELRQLLCAKYKNQWHCSNKYQWTLLHLSLKQPTYSRKSMSIIEACIMTMHSDHIISKNRSLHLLLSTSNLSYIWGQYAIRTEDNKYWFQYAYHAVKAAQD